MEFYKSKYSDKKTDGRSKRENGPSRSFRNSRDDRGSRYSRDDSRSESTTVTCSDCGDECQVPFVPRTNKPVYCSDCFRQHKPDDSGSDGDDRGSRYSRDDRGSRYSRDDRGSRYSRDDRGSRYSRDDSRSESTTVTCSDCGDECQVPFVPRTNKPVYCSDCFRQHKPDDSGSDGDDRGSRYSRDDRGSRYSRDDSRSESTTVTCSDCGDECQVPFVPRTNKPVYCSDCFRQHKPDDSGSDGDDRGSRYSRDDRGSRYSRDDRGSRYSRDDRGSSSSSARESNRNNSRSKKPRSDKFLRKQESFYSDGSAKFYETIKEKLYEILGGKICSSCGFKDERALGISPISDNDVSGNDGRGGDAASWGKYISSPDLAREELKVFCLNCNQIREPASKPAKNSSRSKKSKYFPR